MVYLWSLRGDGVTVLERPKALDKLLDYVNIVPAPMERVKRVAELLDLLEHEDLAVVAQRVGIDLQEVLDEPNGMGVRDVTRILPWLVVAGHACVVAGGVPIKHDVKVYVGATDPNAYKVELRVADGAVLLREYVVPINEATGLPLVNT